MSYRSYGHDYRTEKEKIAMSEKVGRIDEFKGLVENACVHVEERELIAWLGVFKRFTPVKECDSQELHDFIDGVLIPSFREIGRSKWYRDILSDLGLALSKRERDDLSEDTSKVLET